jgi:putative nucleotidyltransferase with HDIG domain
LQKYGLQEKLLMEANKDEAALDFLKKMVRIGPFKDNVYLAGGAVRDMIRGEIPKDLDVVVTNFGKEGGMKFAIWFAQQMGNYKPDSNPVLFPTFGTAKVVLTGTHNGVDLDGFDVEAVFARKEVYTPGSRKPEVFPGTIEDDAFRRDFTVNSLMMNLTTDEILDITGKGKSDIAAGLIRTTSNPDEIFGQDALRMFRAIRFSTKYKWQIDPATWEGIKNNLSNLDNTSYERVRDELDKILMTKDPAYGIRLLRDSGLLSHVSPDLQQAVGMIQNKHHKHDVFDHTMEVLSKTNPVLIQRLMALFHDIGKVVTREETETGVHFIGHEDAGVEIVDRTMRKLKYPLELIDAVKVGVSQHMRLKHGRDDANVSDKVLRKFRTALGQHLEDTLDVIHADNIAHADASAMPNQIANVRKRLELLKAKDARPDQAAGTIKLPINGDDLLAMGVPRGKKIGEILAAIKEAWFENPDISREEAFAIAKSML